MPYVYVLTNPAMPGLVKIGSTDKDDANERITQLYTTGVPVPFDLEYACRVDNPDEVEQAFYQAFAPQRVNPRREFFRIEPDQAIVLLKLLHKPDATAEVQNQAPTNPLDAQSVEAGNKLRSRRQNFNFEDMGIPVGAVLESVHGPATVVVCGPKKVTLNGQEMSFSAATRTAHGWDYNVAPNPHWRYQGRLLKDVYEETYSPGD